MTRFEHKDNTLSLQRLVVVTDRRLGIGEPAGDRRAAAIHPGDDGGRDDVRQARGFNYGITFCDKVLYPVAFTLRNALGQGDYFSGIAADCPAGDDADHQLGDPAEASLAEALTVVRTGQCSAPPVSAAPERRRQTLKLGDVAAEPWASNKLIGAH